MTEQTFVKGTASLNITFNGQNADHPDPIAFALDDQAIKQLARQAVANGLSGVDADANADFSDFVVDRFPANEVWPARLFLRPRVPFG